MYEESIYVCRFVSIGEALDNLQCQMTHKPVKGKGIKNI